MPMRFLTCIVFSASMATIASCSPSTSQDNTSRSAPDPEVSKAGTLTWSGSENGKYTYKTATCTLDLEDNLVAITAPYDVDVDFGAEPAPASLDAPVVNATFGMANGVWVEFIPHPHNVTIKNAFLRVRDYGDGVSWEKKGGHYVLHLRHYDDVASDIRKDPIPEWHAYLTGDITCTKIKNP